MSYREVTATFKKADGTPRKGYITFKPDCALQSATDSVVIVPDPVRVDLSTAGSISITLLCTDTPGIQPDDWWYEVTQHGEYYETEGVLKYSILVPSGTTPLDLASIYWYPNS